MSVGRRARSVPLRPATASEPTNASRIPGFSSPARMTAASVRAVIRSSDDRPEPSTSRTPAVGMSAARISAITTAAPRALVPTRPSSVPRCLRSISAVKLSLSGVHALHDRRERIRRVRGQGNRIAGRGPEPDAPSDGDLARDQRPAQRACREERRRERRPALRTVDHERRERRGLASDEVPLPAVRSASLVERRLVAADPTRDPADPPGAQRRGQAGDVRRGQRRVTVAAEVQVAVPDAARPPADAEHLGREAVSRAEPRQRGPRDGKLLVRRRMDGERVVVRVEHGAGAGVHGDRRRAGERDVRRAQRLRESRREVAGGGERSGDGRRGSGDGAER